MVRPIFIIAIVLAVTGCSYHGGSVDWRDDPGALSVDRWPHEQMAQIEPLSSPLDADPIALQEAVPCGPADPSPRQVCNPNGSGGNSR